MLVCDCSIVSVVLVVEKVDCGNFGYIVVLFVGVVMVGVCVGEWVGVG